MFEFWRIPFVSSQHIHFNACIYFNNLECNSLCPLFSFTLGFFRPSGYIYASSWMITQWIFARGCSVPRMTHLFGDDSLPNRGGWKVRGSPYPTKNSFFVCLKKNTQMMNSLIWGLWVGEPLQWSRLQRSS